MYQEYFGLKERPFLLTPDADYLFLSAQHAQAKAHMDYTVMNRDSCVVVTGDIGCGKTTLINKFLGDIDENILAARVFQTQVTPEQFLQTLLVQFGFQPFEKRKVELLDMLTRFLLENAEKGQQIVLVVDEAQNLSLEVLEEIRLLTDIEMPKAKAINVILCGQPELSQKLALDRMHQFVQRVRFRVHLRPLTQGETGDYIAHRLHIAGREDGHDLFPLATIPLIYRYTGGVPRLINTLCDTALTAAFVEDEVRVTPDLLQTAFTELGWVPFSQRARRGDLPAEPVVADGAAARLMLMRDGSLLSALAMNTDRIMIGRDSSNDIAIASQYISRNHASFRCDAGRYSVQDLNSTNGTFLNGRRIRQAVLRDGDIVAVGQHRVVFKCAGALPKDSSVEEVEWHRETSVMEVPAADRDEPAA